MAGKRTSSLAWRSALTLALLIGGCVLVYGALQTYAGPGIPRHTMVGGVTIGGMERAEAADTLRRAFPLDRQFLVHINGKSFALPSVNAAVRVDIEATLERVARERWHPVRLVEMLRGVALSPKMVVDASRLTSPVRAMNQVTATPAVDAGIDMSGEAPVVSPARSGLGLDETRAARAIVDAAQQGVREITLQRVPRSAQVTTLAAEQVLRNLAQPAIAAPVTVTIGMGDGTVRSSIIQPETIRAALSFPVVDGKLTPVLDGLVLRTDVDESVFDVQKFAKRAKFRVRGESITVVPSEDGYGVSAASIAADVVRVLANAGADRTVSLQMGPITPSFSTADAEALEIKELMSTYEQEFPAAAYRTINIGTAARYINGTILRPGETFSMNEIVKERTVENGYTEGWIIGPGGVFRNELGGAVSTITTAVYNAAWFAGLKLVEHRAHSIYMPRYRPGREATVSWGSFDMRFRNNLDHAILITTKLRSTSITVNFWGTKQWEIGSEFGPWLDQRPYPEIRSTDPECHEQDGMVGFRITVWRIFYGADGVERKREPHTSTYRPSPHVICIAPKPKPKPVPSPGTTPTSPLSDTSTV